LGGDSLKSSFAAIEVFPRRKSIKILDDNSVDSLKLFKITIFSIIFG